ncbi:MAG: hypothetical protein HZA29_01150 [Candidatus Omnitrophica bacterium]|nr:hypothetical protein [Candidatus Omnitrophota bacterium]
MLRKFLAVFALLIVFAGAGCLSPGTLLSAFADEEIEHLKNEMQSMRETIAQLQQTIDHMQAVIVKYEAAPPAAVSAAPAPGSGEEVAELHQELQSFKGVVDKFPKISGYYDFEWHADDQGDSTNTFKQHHLSLFLDKRLEKWHMFSEVEFEYAFDYAGSGGAVTGNGEAKVETGWLEYNYNDLENIRFGKVIIPQYWSVNHYPSVIFSTSRPLMNEQIIPFDTTGVMAYGTHYFPNEWGAGYNVFVGNGEGSARSQTDNNNNKVFGGKLTAHIPVFDRFDVAGLTYIGENGGNNSETMWGAETQMDIADFGFQAEVAHNSNQGQFGYYLQPSYRFLPKWTAFYRWDRLDVNKEIDDASDASSHTAGLRYQPVPAISLKGELYHKMPDDQTLERVNGLISSVVIFF